MLATGILRSRRRLPDDEYLEHILHNNSVVRPEESSHFDKSQDWLDYVNLSLSEINASFFQFSRGWGHNQDLWWAILSFDTAIAGHPDVYFATTNNSYEHCDRNPGLGGLQSLFAQRIRRRNSWFASRGIRPSHLPTCQQAEVLYPGEIPLQFLRRIYVARGEDQDRVRGWLREFDFVGVEVILAPTKFSGAPN